MAKKKEFKSNVTGEEWFKHSSKTWRRTINQVGIVLEDEVHQGKKGTTVTLKKGTEVYIDDIRGRIKPQYRVKDGNGKIWFVSALNIEVLKGDKTEDTNLVHGYRGGVRHDGSKAAPYRYTVEKTTEDELNDLKTQRRSSNG